MFKSKSVEEMLIKNEFDDGMREIGMRNLNQLKKLVEQLTF